VNAELIAKLIEAGTPAELVAEVAVELGRAHAAQEALESRRKHERERKARSRDVTGQNVTERDDAEIQDKGSPEVSPPAPPLPKPSKSAPLSPPKSKGVEVPDWMPAEPWAAFKEMRRKMRSVPFTETAERGIIADIEKLRTEGHDPVKVLMKAVKRGYRGVFGDQDTLGKAGGKIEKSAQQLREDAEWFVKHGQPDMAEECRRKAIAKEQGIAA
jgi:hypothetical protein